MNAPLSPPENAEPVLPAKFAAGFSSWRRTLSKAPPENRERVFRFLAQEARGYVNAGLSKQITVDECQAIADDFNLIGEIDVQAVLADAFADKPPIVLDAPPLQSSQTTNVTPWWRDPATIPQRQWLYGRHYQRRTIGATIGGGGRGKTTLGTCEAISMATGRDLIKGGALSDPLRVWVINAEEDQDELDRRFAATCLHYGVNEADLGGRLFVQSVRDCPLRLATLVKGIPTANRQVIDAMKQFITEHRIDVFMIDPFVSFHSVAENDNGQMDLVIKEGLGAIAGATNSAGEIFHHPGKPKPGQAETTVDDGRGASAIVWAVRSARVLNFMTPDHASKFGIPDPDRRQYVSISNGKANMGPQGKANWMRLTIENLPNGDQVAVANHWSVPDPFQGITASDMQLARQLAGTGGYRADSRSPQWFGYALAPHLKIAVSYGVKNDPKEFTRLQSIIAKWLENKVLETETRKVDHKDKTFIVVGSFRSEPQAKAGDFDEEFADP
jgi:AAA domain